FSFFFFSLSLSLSFVLLFLSTFFFSSFPPLFLSSVFFLSFAETVGDFGDLLADFFAFSFVVGFFDLSASFFFLFASDLFVPFNSGTVCACGVRLPVMEANRFFDFDDAAAAVALATGVAGIAVEE